MNQNNNYPFNNVGQYPYNFFNGLNNNNFTAQPVNVVMVSGRNGAEAYKLPPNSSALLLDESGLMVWLVKTDGAGYQTISCYDIMPHQEQPALTYNDFELLNNRITQLEAQIGGIINGNTTDTTATTVDPAKSKSIVIKQS